MGDLCPISTTSFLEKWLTKTKKPKLKTVQKLQPEKHFEKSVRKKRILKIWKIMNNLPNKYRNVVLSFIHSPRTLNSSCRRKVFFARTYCFLLWFLQIIYIATTSRNWLWFLHKSLSPKCIFHGPEQAFWRSTQKETAPFAVTQQPRAATLSTGTLTSPLPESKAFQLFMALLPSASSPHIIFLCAVEPPWWNSLQQLNFPPHLL